MQLDVSGTLSSDGGKYKKLVEVFTTLTGPSGSELGVYRHIVSAHVSPIPYYRSHKNPVGGGRAHTSTLHTPNAIPEVEHVDLSSC